MSQVLLVSPSGVAGGAERAFAGLARRLPELGWQPHSVLLQHGPLEAWLTDAGCPVEVVVRGRTRQVHRTAFAIAALVKAARRTGSCIVVSNQSSGHIYGGTAARVAGLPGILWQQGIPEASLLERIAARVPAAAIVASCRAAVISQRRLAPRRRIELIHLGTAVGDIERRSGEGSALRSQLGLTEHPTIGVVGRLQPWKGQHLFLRAAAQVATARPDARFLVIGGAVLGSEGTYPAELKQLAYATPELRDRVHFIDHQEDVYPWYDALDVVVHASASEPFGLVLVEAMALGRPLVATAAGGPTEIVEDGQSGLLVAPGNVHAMAAAVLRIVNDGTLATRLARGARERAHSFSDEQMARQWADLLLTVRPRHRSGRHPPWSQA